MTKYTQKQLRSLVSAGVAVDISGHTVDDSYKMYVNEGFLEKIGYASGVYGCSGLLLRGHETGSLYAITRRTPALSIYG